MSADSKKLQEIIDTTVGLATIFFVEQFYFLTIEIPGFNKSLYKRAIKGIPVSEIAYPFEHCGLVHMLFQYNQHISYEELETQLMDNRCNWLFDDRQIR